MTQFGQLPLTDGDRNVIRLSCKALKVWDHHVSPHLPYLTDEEGDFELDAEDADLDGEAKE